MKFFPQFFNLMMIFIIILTTSTILTNGQVFNCVSQMPENGYIPIQIQTPPINQATTVNGAFMKISENIWALSHYLQTVHFVKVRFTFAEPLTINSQSNTVGVYTAPYSKSKGLTLRLPNAGVATSSGGQVQPTPDVPYEIEWGNGINWSNPNMGWCNNDPNVSMSALKVDATIDGTFWNTNWAPKQLVNAAQKIAIGLNVYFSQCNANAMACIPSLNDASVCGDGIVNGDEECDILQAFSPTAFKRPYFSSYGGRYSNHLSCDSNCRRMAVNHNVVSYILQKSSWALTHDAMQNCEVEVPCGINELPITQTLVYLSTAGTPNAVGNQHTAFQVLGVPNPIISTQYSLPITCTGNCNELVIKSWWCRKPDIGSNIGATWYQCNDANSRDEYLPIIPATAPTDPAIVATLGLNDLTPLGSHPFICGKTYYRRTVGCVGRLSNGAFASFPDGDCTADIAGVKPKSVILGQNKQCVMLGYIDVYHTEDILSVTGASYSSFYIPLPASVPHTTSPPLPTFGAEAVGCTPFSSVNSICVRSCDATYTRQYKCLRYQPLKFNPTNDGTGSVVLVQSKPTFVVESSPDLQYCNNIHNKQTTSAQTDGVGCNYSRQCRDAEDNEISCDQYERCGCQMTEVTILRQCWGVPIKNVQQSGTVLAMEMPNGEACTQESPHKIQCLQHNRNNNCYKVELHYTKPSDEPEDAPPSEPRSRPPSYFSTTLFDRFCNNNRFPSEHFVPKCVIGQGQTTVVAFESCTPEQVDQALYCTVAAYAFHCTIHPSPTSNPNISMSRLLELGYDEEKYSTPSPENCHPLTQPKLNPAFCGPVVYSVLFVKCTPNGNGRCPDVLPNEFFDTRSLSYTAGCQMECFDAASDEPGQIGRIPLGPCNGRSSFPATRWNTVSCGPPTSTVGACALQQRKVYSECVYYFNGGRYLVKSSITCGHLQPFPSYSSVQSPITRDCFKLSSTVAFDTPLSEEQYSSLEELTRSSRYCSFKPLCQYKYSPSSFGNELSLDDFKINPKSPIDATYWSTNACTTQFDCTQPGVCGKIDIKMSCGLFSNNAVVGFATTHGDYKADNRINPDHHLRDLSTLFSKIPVGYPCGQVKATGCNANNDYNCKVPRCHLPTDFETLVDPSTIDRDLWSAEQCEDAARVKHCALNMQDTTKCQTVQLPVYFECYDVRTQTYVADSSCVMHRQDDPQTGITMRPCDIVKGCDVWTNECFWQNKNPQMPTSFTDSLGERSEELCNKFVNEKDTICNTTDLCGKARSGSSCVASKSTTESSDEGDGAQNVLDDSSSTTARTVRFVLDADLCEQLWDGFKNFNSDDNLSIECTNHARCSSWACSTTNLPHLLPSLENIISRTSGASAIDFFHSTTGTIQNSFCYNDLKSLSAESTTCGVTQIERRVGCLTHKTKTHFLQETWHFDPDATSCGSFQHEGHAHIPINSTSIFTQSGCSNKLTCALGGNEYDTEACDYLKCPVVFRTTNDPFTNEPITGTTFGYDQQLRCVGHDGTILPHEECMNTAKQLVSVNGRVTETTTSCPYVTNYCQRNLQVPMGFSPYANMTTVSGKYRPDQINPSDKNKLPALNVKFMLDNTCTNAATLSSIGLIIDGSSFKGNITRTAGQSDLTFQFTYNYYSGRTLSVLVYLVHTSDINLLNVLSLKEPSPSEFIMPYLIGTVTPGLTSSFSLPIPDWVPQGEYIVVLYVNNVLFDWIADSYITIKSAPVPAPPTDGDGDDDDDVQSFVLQAPITIDGIYGNCNQYLCLNGECVGGKCQCKSGYTGEYCAQRLECATAAENALQEPNSSTPNAFVCNSKYGIVGADPTQTASNTCNRCTCLGNFDPTDGCNTCKLQCGTGTVNKSCTQCTCPSGYSGTQCECYTKRILMKYRSPPAFIVKMFNDADGNNTVDPYTPKNPQELAQLTSWKASLLHDLAHDLAVSASTFTIAKFGSTRQYFGVYVDIKLCNSYPIIVDNSEVPPLTTSEKMALSRQQQAEDLIFQFTEFDKSLSLLQKYSQEFGPIIGFDDPDNHLQWHRPSFDFYNLFKRFKILDGSIVTAASVATLIDNKNDKINNMKLFNHDNEMFLTESELFYDDEINSQHYNNDLTLAATPSNLFNVAGIETKIASRYQYSHPAVTMSVVSDTSGGFLGISNVYDATMCETTPNVSGCDNAGAELTPTIPDPPKERSEPFDKTIILYIFIALIFVLLFAGPILLCCAWKYQCLMFKDFQEKRKQARKQARVRKSGRSTGMSATGVSDLTSGVSAIQGKQVQMDDLAKGWTAYEQDGKVLFVNSETMQSSAIKPNLDGSIPAANAQKGW